MNADATPSSSIAVERESAPAWGFAGVVSLAGEHDLATSGELEDALNAIPGDVLVDLSACTFIDSTIIGVILDRAQTLKAPGHRLELVAPPNGSIVGRVIQIVGMRSLITVHDGELGAREDHASVDGHAAS